jgi:hypothetical protein
MKNSRNFQKKWDNTNVKYWQENLRPPWRPSPGDIKNYKAGLKIAAPLKNILILGATPELRNLAGSFGVRPWIIDSSRKMVSEMSKLVSPSAARREKIVVSNWNNLNNLRSLKGINFDVILGDLVFRLINPEKRGAFLGGVAKLLKPEGFFISRIHFINKSLAKSSIGEIIEKAFLLLDPKISGRGAYVKNLLISRILDKNSFWGGAEKIRIKSRADIKDYLAANPPISLNRKIILRGVLNRFAVKRLATFFSQTKKEIEENLNPFFKIEDKLTANDYNDVKFFPTYILRPRVK